MVLPARKRIKIEDDAKNKQEGEKLEEDDRKMKSDPKYLVTGVIRKEVVAVLKDRFDEEDERNRMEADLDTEEGKKRVERGESMEERQRQGWQEEGEGRQTKSRQQSSEKTERSERTKRQEKQ